MEQSVAELDEAVKIAINMLGKGMSAADTAHVLDCDIAAIEAIQDNYRDEIASINADVQLVQQSNDINIDRLEQIAVQKLEKCLHYETDITKITTAFKALNGATRRSRGENRGAVTNNVAVVMLPESIKKNLNYRTDTTNEIVEVNGKPMITAKSEQVADLLSLHLEKQNEPLTIEDFKEESEVG